jgi:hypothetical protein
VTEEPPSPSPPPEGDDTADGSADDEPIKSPFETGTINYMEFDREQLAIALEGPPVSGKRVDLSVGGPFLYRLHEVLHTLAAHVQSRFIGQRGKLPQLSGGGAIALAGLTQGSAVLHFTIADEPEQLIITQAGEVGSAMEEAVNLLVEVVERSARAGSEEELLELMRALPDRAGTNYVDMLDVIVANGVTTRWQTGSRKVALAPTRAAHTKGVLERVEILSVEDVERVGLLYEANSKRMEFRLEVQGSGTIQGTYDEDLTEVIRGAWNHLVRVKLRLTHRRLERSGADRPADVELIEITELLD